MYSDSYGGTGCACRYPSSIGYIGALLLSKPDVRGYRGLLLLYLTYNPFIFFTAVLFVDLQVVIRADQLTSIPQRPNNMYCRSKGSSAGQV